MPDVPAPADWSDDEDHRDLPIGWWIFDYLLALLFIVAGPLYYFTEVRTMAYVTELGRMFALSLQMSIHFGAAAMFLTVHFAVPRNGSVLSVLGIYRVILAVATVLCLAGFWPQAHMMRSV